MLIDVSVVLHCVDFLCFEMINYGITKLCINYNHRSNAINPTNGTLFSASHTSQQSIDQSFNCRQVAIQQPIARSLNVSSFIPEDTPAESSINSDNHHGKKTRRIHIGNGV